MFSSRVPRQPCFLYLWPPLLPAFYVRVSGHALGPGRTTVVLGQISFGSVSASWKLLKALKAQLHKLCLWYLTMEQGARRKHICIHLGMLRRLQGLGYIQGCEQEIHKDGSYSGPSGELCSDRSAQVGGSWLVPAHLWGVQLGSITCREVPWGLFLTAFQRLAIH